MGDYIIIGDTKKYEGCLVYVCGTLDSANNCLQRMLNNPTEYDKRLMRDHSNLRIKKVQEEDCWWHGNCD
jgi:hypothetical protein